MRFVLSVLEDGEMVSVLQHKMFLQTWCEMEILLLLNPVSAFYLKTAQMLFFFRFQFSMCSFPTCAVSVRLHNETHESDRQSGIWTDCEGNEEKRAES